MASIFEQYPDFPGSTRGGQTFGLPLTEQIFGKLKESAEQKRIQAFPAMSAIGGQQPRTPYFDVERRIAEGWLPTEEELYRGELMNKYARAGEMPKRYEDQISREIFLAVLRGDTHTTSTTETPGQPAVNHTPFHTPAMYKKGQREWEGFMDFLQQYKQPIPNAPPVNARDAQGNVIQVPQMRLPQITPQLISTYADIRLMNTGDMDGYVALRAFYEGMVKRGGAPPKTIRGFGFGDIMPWAESGFSKITEEIQDYQLKELRASLEKKGMKPETARMFADKAQLFGRSAAARGLDVGSVTQAGLGAWKYSIVGPLAEQALGFDLREHTGHAGGAGQQVAYGVGAVSMFAILHSIGGAGFRMGAIRNTPEALAATGKVFAREGIIVGGTGARLTNTLAKWGMGVQKGTPLEMALTKSLQYNIPREGSIVFNDLQSLSLAQAESMQDIFEDTIKNLGWSVFLPAGFAAAGTGAKVGADTIWSALGKRELAWLSKDPKALIEMLEAKDIKRLLKFTTDKPPDQILRGIGYNKWMGEPLKWGTEKAARVRVGKTVTEWGKTKIVHPRGVGVEAESALHSKYSAIYPFVAARTGLRNITNMLNKVVDGYSEIGVDSYSQNMLRLVWGMSESYKQAGISKIAGSLEQVRKRMTPEELAGAQSYIHLRAAVPMAKGTIEQKAKLYVSPEFILKADKGNVLGFADPKKVLGMTDLKAREGAILEALAVTDVGKLYGGLTGAQREIVEMHDTMTFGIERVLRELGANITPRKGYTPGVYAFLDEAKATVQREVELGMVTRTGEAAADVKNIEHLGKQVDNLYHRKGLFNQAIDDPFTAAIVRTEMLASNIMEDAAIRHVARHMNALVKPSKMRALFGDRAQYVASEVKSGRVHTVVDRSGNEWWAMMDNPDLLTPTIAKGLRGTPAKTPRYRMATGSEQDAKLLSYHPASQTLVYMNPREYLKLAGKGKKPFKPFPATVAKLRARLKAEKPTDALFLDYEIGTGAITGQEGRHRALAAIEEGIDEVPVILYAQSEGRYVLAGKDLPEALSGLRRTPAANRGASEQKDMENLIRHISHTNGADAVHAGQAGVLDAMAERFGFSVTNFAQTKYNPVTGIIEGDLKFASQRMLQNANVGEANALYLVPKPLMNLWKRQKFNTAGKWYLPVNKVVQGWKRFVLMLAEPGFSTRNFYSDLMAAGNLQPEVFTKLGDAAWALTTERGLSSKIYECGSAAAAMKKYPALAKEIEDFSNVLRLTQMEFANMGRLSGDAVRRRMVDIRKALRNELGSKLSDAQIDALIGLRISEQQGVLTSLFVTETAQARGLPIKVNKMIDEFRGGWLNKVRPVVGAPMRAWEGAAGIRENTPRLAAMLSQIEKINAGQPVVTKVFSNAGLDKLPLWSAGKTCRTVQVDYGNQDPAYRALLGQGLAPFYVWHAQTIRNVAKTLANPITASQAAAKVYMPLTIIAAWNAKRNVDVPEHIAQGIWIDSRMDDEESGLPIVFALDTPIQKGSQWFGGEVFFENMREIMDGRMSIKTAAMKMVKRCLGAEGITKIPIVEATRDIAMPIAKVIKDGISIMDGSVEYGDLRDGFSGARVFSERHVTAEGEFDVKGFMREWSTYAASELVTPASVLVGQIRRGEVEAPETTLGSAGAAMSASIKRMGEMERALGIREVDLRAVRRSNAYDAAEKFDNIGYSRKKVVKDAYVAMMVDPANKAASMDYIDKWTKLRDEAAVDKGDKGAKSWLDSLLDNPWINLDISRQRMAKLLSKGYKPDSPEVKALKLDIQRNLDEGMQQFWGGNMDTFERMAMEELLGETKMPPYWPLGKKEAKKKDESVEALIKF